MNALTKALLLTAVIAAAGCGDESGTASPTTAGPSETAADASGADTDAVTDAETDAETTSSMAPTSSVAPTTVATVPPTSAPEAEVLFDDPLDDDTNGWGEVDDEFGSLRFADGSFQWRSTGRFVGWTWSVFEEFAADGRTAPDLYDVTVRAEATPIAGTGVIGVSCRTVPDNVDASFQAYEFVARDGYAAIRLSDDQSHIEVLAELDGASLPAGQPATIEGTCVDLADGTVLLEFVLNGQLILSATDDDPLGNGFPALVLWTFPVHEQTDVDWHHFTVLRATTP